MIPGSGSSEKANIRIGVISGEKTEARSINLRRPPSPLYLNLHPLKGKIPVKGDSLGAYPLIFLLLVNHFKWDYESKRFLSADEASSESTNLGGTAKKKRSSHWDKRSLSLGGGQLLTPLVHKLNYGRSSSLRSSLAPIPCARTKKAL